MRILSHFVKPVARSVPMNLIPKELLKLVRSKAQYLCTGFGIAYNFVIERSSEYTVGVP